MKLNPHRWKFSHPDIPICPDRLRKVIAAGDAADQAMMAPHLLREIELTNPGDRRAGARLRELQDRQTSLLAQRDRLRGARGGGAAEQLASVDASLEHVRADIRAVVAEENAARQALIRVTETRRRCVEYSIECGHKSPDLTRFTPVMGVAR